MHPSIHFLTIPPPIHPDDDLVPPPASILLDLEGFISDRTNANTFWAAHPPRASCFTVYSQELELSDFGGAPKILNTVDDLALLRVPVCSPCCYRRPWHNDFFVYQAGTESRRPSLDLIPRPPTLFLSDYQAGLLRCGDMYFVAILRWDGQYNLHLYNSETGTWTAKMMHLDSQMKSLCILSSKVITIGGNLGSIGWVDLLKGILICDVLLDNHELRHIPLPPPVVPKPCGGPPSLVRDVIVLEGYIKYFEMCLYTDKGWEAVQWRRKGSWNKWKKDGMLGATRSRRLLKPKSSQP